MDILYDASVIRDIVKHQSGTPSGTGVSVPEMPQFRDIYEAGEMMVLPII